MRRIRANKAACCPVSWKKLAQMTEIEPATPVCKRVGDYIQVVVQAALNTTNPPERHPSCCSEDAPTFRTVEDVANPIGRCELSRPV
jgi:hypothetical protein